MLPALVCFAFHFAVAFDELVRSNALNFTALLLNFNCKMTGKAALFFNLH